MKFKPLTNVRPTKDYGCQVITAPTEGTIKITPEAAARIGVTTEQHLGLVELEDEDGNPMICIFKGDEKLGAKLASTSKSGGGVLNCSSAVAWKALQGSADHNVHYDVADEALEIDEVTREGMPSMYKEREFFVVTFVEKVEKQRKTKSEKSTDSDADAILPSGEPSNVGTPEPSNAAVDSFDDL